MRLSRLVLVVGLAAFAVPAWADDRPQHPNTGQCRRLTRQIERYVDDAELARERDNELWETASMDQVERLATRRARLCPEYAYSDNRARQMAALLAAAAKAAAAYFAPVP